MADISDVKTADLKEILENLDALSCMCTQFAPSTRRFWDMALTLDPNSPDHHQNPVLETDLAEPSRFDPGIHANRMASEAFGTGKTEGAFNQLI